MPAAELVCLRSFTNKDLEMWKYYYDETGLIAFVSEDGPGITTNEDQFECYESETYLDPDQWRIDPVTKQPVQRVKQTVSRTLNWATKRNLEYGTAEQQLGLLYDDIVAGVFGEAAKSSAWVQHIASVKAANPKQ